MPSLVSPLGAARTIVSPLGVTAASGAFNPSSIAGLKLWVKADSLALNDGDAVDTWTDQSGNGNDAVQGTAANRPIKKDNIQNGKPVVRFDGIDDYLGFDGSYFVNHNYTVFLVEGRRSSGINFALGEYSGGGYCIAVGYNSGTVARYTQLDADLDATVSDYSSQQFVLWSYRMNSIGREMMRNGVSVASSGITFALGSYVNAAIGALAPYSYFRGDIAEILMYAAPLSDADRASVTTYLNTKWAIY